MLVGVHSSLVIRLVPGETAIAILFFCAAILTEASPVAELPRSVIMSTLSLSNQFRAIFTATSALLALSAATTSIGLPSTWPPKSFTAIFTARTAPGPAISDRNPVMSVSTPIFTTPSDIWAAVSVVEQARPTHAIAAAESETFEILIAVPFAGLLRHVETGGEIRFQLRDPPPRPEWAGLRNTPPAGWR